MENTILFTTKTPQSEVKVFVDGTYTETGLNETWKVSGSIYEYKDIVSVQFNQLKAKLYNTIEAAITDKEQREAVKGLIRGFCNENYRNTIKDLRGLLNRMGLAMEVCEPMDELRAEPLEN